MPTITIITVGMEESVVLVAQGAVAVEELVPAATTTVPVIPAIVSSQTVRRENGGVSVGCPRNRRPWSVQGVAIITITTAALVTDPLVDTV